MSISQVMPGSRLYDDTEEDLVGADWHQRAILTIVTSLQDFASDHNLPWHVGNQLAFVCAKPDRSSWCPVPDVMLHTRAGAAERAEMRLRSDGLPDLIIEVASPSTWDYDVDVAAGKAWGYMALGIANYLVFDPAGDLLEEGCRGRQHQAGEARPWRSSDDGRYHALGLDISFKAEGSLLRVFDSDGSPVAFPHENACRVRSQQYALQEKEHVLREQQWEMDAQARRLAELEAELARLRGQG
ncbi:MAG: Uma2 family endonuclease [Chloroflexota bacterium]